MKKQLSKNNRNSYGVPRRLAWLNIALVLAMIFSFLPGIVPGTEIETASAHNLQTEMYTMFLDQPTQALLDAKVAGGWTPGTPILSPGDQVGLIIKVIPRETTTTGVGGHIDFYVPNGTTVVDAAYLVPDGAGGFIETAMKGQSPIAIGDGPIGAKTTPELIGLGAVGPNINGVTENPVTATGTHRGTIAGLYGDTGIFFSTDPDTSYGSWQRYTGDWNNSGPNRCGLINPDTLPNGYTPLPPNGKSITNNSGDVFVPCNKWDAEQMYAWGVKGTTFAGPGASSSPIVDYPDGRGNAPWGFASGVAGPQSGYAWHFDWDEYAASAKDAAAIRAAMGNDEIGPWQRLKYPGSRLSYDQAGKISAVIGYANIDGSNVGVYDLKTQDLPDTTSQTDGTSPKAIRWAVGQLTAFRPEYVWVKIKVNNVNRNPVGGFLDSSGCPVFHADTFGGDAGGTDNGKDHLWRYYQPSEFTWNGCLAVSKTGSAQFVKVGETFSYNLKIYNLGDTAQTNVVIEDMLPSSVSFISAVPAQTSGPNPLVWKIGTLNTNQLFQATLTVKANSTGYIDNCVKVTSDQGVQNTCDTTIGGNYPYLVPTKSVTPTSVAPGGTVTYTLLIKNVGGGATGNPVTVTEYLPSGFTYQSLSSVIVNGASYTGTTTVNSTNPAQPVFTVPAAIQGFNQMTLSFVAKLASNITPGKYCNTYAVSQNGVPTTSGSQGCVDVGGGKIGDKIWRDWDGDGLQDPEEEGIAGVPVQLYASDGTTLLQSTTTDANGNYYFNGLTAGTYVVKVNGGTTPAGYTQTGDPDASIDNIHTVSLATDQQYLTADFGYKPTGTASIGDQVFDDKNNDGLFDPDGVDNIPGNADDEVGIANITLRLYEDTNGNGVIDAGIDALVATTTTNASGIYGFTGLAAGYDYLVDVDQTDSDLSTYYGGNPYQVTTPDPHPVDNLSGAYTAADFGFWKTEPSSIGDQVWYDTDGDNIKDATESGIPNVTVNLYLDSDGDGILDPGEPLLETDVTDGNGIYTFSNLGAGKYIVDVDQNDPDIQSGYLTGKDYIAVNLPVNTNRTDVDFPFFQSLAKSVDKATAASDDTLTYTIVPRYPGFEILSSIVIADTIPLGTTYVPLSINAGGEAIDETDPPDGIIESVVWDLGGNSPGVDGYTGGTPPAACQTTMTVEASADTWIDEKTSEIAKNYGTDVEIDTSNRANQDRAALLRFSTIISGLLPAGATYNSAQLQVTTAGGAGANRQVEVHELLTAWTEGTSNNGATCTSAGNGAAWQGPNCTDAWLTGTDAFGASDFNPTNLGTINPTSNNTTYTADLTTTVSNWLAGGTNRGLVLWGAGTDTGIVNWHSREASGGNVGLKPKIVITYTPNGCNGTTVIRENGANNVPDTFIKQDKLTEFHGGDNRLKTKQETGKNEVALVRFDLTGAVPAGATVSSATLYLQVASAKANHTGEIHYLTTAWTEGTNSSTGATWSDPNGTGTAGTWAAGNFSSSDYNAAIIGSINTSTTGGKTLNLTNTVRDWVNGTYSNNGLVIIGRDTNNDEAQYYSSEEGTATRRPSLTINWNIPPSNPVGVSSIVAGPSLVQDGDTVTVKMTLTNTSGAAINNVAPSTLNIVGSNSAACTALAGPTPATANVPAGGSAIFTWTCTADVPANTIGGLTFDGSASNGPQTWSKATSNRLVIAVPLTFQVTVNNPAGVNVVENTAILNAGSMTINSNTVETALTGSIGDFVWSDVDGDGIQDPGEPGLAGVVVWLDTNNNGIRDPGEPFDTTNGLGLYRIFGLGAGSYNVKIDPTTFPAGYVPTTDTSLSVTLTTNQQYSNADFGLQPPGNGSIGDYVWNDTNSDGVQDPSELGLPNITVKLYRDLDGNGLYDPLIDAYVNQTTTDASGNYSFNGLPTASGGNPVKYLVIVDETSDVVSPYGGGTVDLGAAMDPTTGTSNPRSVTLSNAVPSVTTADFGYKWTGSIGDFVWYDLNANGLYESGLGETGVPGAFVMVYWDMNNNNILEPGEPQIGAAFTNGSGIYTVPNLPPGNYVVDVYEDSVPVPGGGTVDLLPSTGETHAVDLAPSQNYTLADFGYFQGAIVEGTVYHDVDHNGILDSGEPGLTPVTVTLVGYDINGNPVSKTTLTDGSGNYQFLVPPGNYTVSYSTPDVLAINPGLTQPTTPTSTLVTAVSGEHTRDIDFGVDNPGKIGDRVWNDPTNFGVQDPGENGLPGVTVRLYDNTGTILLATTATDASGNYMFEGLPDGTYTVKVDPATAPSGYTATTPTQFTAVVTGGGSDLDNDFGFKPPASTYTVTGRVWDDQDGGGSQNGAEPGIPGVTVCLYDSTGTTLVACTTTNATGDYSFPGVPDGTYLIKVDPDTLPSNAYVQTGDPDGLLDHQSTVTVSGANPPPENFGYQQQFGSISGTVCDGNGDGLCDDPGETPGLAGVPVYLTYAGDDGWIGTPDDQVFATTTDASGNYSFTNLEPGVYQLVKSTPDGKTSLADADGGNPNNISLFLAPGQVKNDQDFEVKPAAGLIGDTVWLDTDGDGVQDIGEPGLANVDVCLYNNTGPTLVACTTTDMNGNYLFTDVPPGSYYVDVVNATLPPGLAASPGSPENVPFTLASGESKLDVDLGFTGSDPAKAIIGDFVWSDDNANGIQDPGEPGINGVTLALMAPGVDGILGTGDDVIAQTAFSGPDGHYYFTNVTPGDYLVDVTTAPAGYTLTSGPQSNPDPTNPITVSAGEVYLDADFGYVKPSLASITDQVWYDADRDGIFDPTESGISGVTVNLWTDPNGDGDPSDGVIVSTDITGPDGLISFPGVPDGNYVIVISDINGVLNDLQYTTPDAATGQRPVIVAGADVTGEHFGYAGLGPIGDTVFSDHNGNAVQDPGEPGIPGVQVKLYFDDGDGVFEPATGDVLIGTQTTDGSGQYLFSDLPAGTFWVSVDDSQATLTGYTPTTTDQHPATATTTEYKVTLTTTQPSFLDADYGYQKTTLADVSGTVFNDTNQDGLQNPGEPGIPGVTVCLRTTSGEIAACTTTDANGDYTFPDVPPGNYVVGVTDEAGILEDYTLTSGLDNIPVTVGGTNITNIDFGYVRTPDTASIGDYVWHDADRDGVQDASETGLPGVILKLYDAGPNGAIGGGDDTLLATTTTDANGGYSFQGLPAGNYYVDLDQTSLPAGMTATTGTADPTAIINLSNGEPYDKADFGYGSQTGSAIGDRIWNDVNGNGVQDPGEVGIGGVTVKVYNSSDTLIATVTTDPDGYYLVSGLTITGSSSNYKVEVTPPAGFNPTPTNWPTASQVFSVPNGSDVLYADFGFQQTTPNRATIGDLVYLDANGNGLLDPGEAGIPGVTVNLLDNLGNIIATTTTDPNGNYYFSGVPDGTYTVVVTDLDGVLNGLNESDDPDAILDEQAPLVISGGHITSIGGVPCSSCDTNVDFGYAPAGGSIGNLVFHDVNGNGIREAAEDGLEGVTLNLWLDVNGNGTIEPGVDNLIRTTTTDENGNYEFKGLPPAKYLVDVTDRSGVLTGLTKTSGALGVDNNSQADPYSVTLTSGAPSNFTADFGYTTVQNPLSIAGSTFEDKDSDGYYDPTDVLASNVLVFLYRDLDNDGRLDPGDPLIGVTRSDTNGDYIFTNLPGNTNYIVATDTIGSRVDGYFQTTQKTTFAVQPVALTTTNSVDNDFGFVKYTSTPTSVTLESFTAAFTGPASVTVQWISTYELNVVGYNLYRATTFDGTRAIVNPAMIPATGPGSTYAFDDLAVQSDLTYYYWLEVIVAPNNTAVLLEDIPPAVASLGKKVFLPVINRR